jgi:hypothetical protein
MENVKRTIECPNCGQKLVFPKLAAGYTTQIPCLTQWDRTVGCGYVIEIKLSEKKYGEK